MKLPPYFFVFDVESIGLHGEGFAYGYVVVDVASGAEVEFDRRAVHCQTAHGAPDDREWVMRNVPGTVLCGTHRPDELKWPSTLRRQLFAAWTRWRHQGAWLAADVAWPVEARFLLQAIDDDAERATNGPYPLIDIASVRLAVGFDPLGTEERRENERPKHDPLADARQSARLLMEALAVSARALR